MQVGRALLLVVCAGCSGSVGPAADLPAGSIETRASNADGTVIGTLELRDYDVTIKLGPDGRRYDVASSDGRRLATDVDAAYLAQNLPEVHELLHDIWAGM